MVRSLKFDSLFITTVGVSSTVVAVVLYYALGAPHVSPFLWLLLVVGFDVSHVYSTTFRTYFNWKKSGALKTILIVVPILSFLSALLLASLSIKLFWTALVYVAVFHFARQQIGFLRIYTQPENRSAWTHFANEFFIYIFTLGSIFVWHLQGHKTFNWFTADDFYYLQKFSYLIPTVNFVILASLVACVILNCFTMMKKKVSVHSFLILISTFVSWYFPIVYFNSDFVFTMANVLAHAIPYLAVVWAFEKKRNSIFKSLQVFFPILFMAAFLEEALWDSLVWREHTLFFESFYFLPQLKENSLVMAFTLALLICPQLTHYVLDGFIWKRKYMEY